MSRLTPAINLQFGKNDLSYQDVILLTLINCASPRLHATCMDLLAMQRCSRFCRGAPVQIIPKRRGSHSEISGM